MTTTFRKILGVDLSEHNGEVDFQALKDDGCEFVILRCSYGTHEDSRFREYASLANEAGLRLGAYCYSYALNPSSAREEARVACEIVNSTGLLFDIPLFFDQEDADGYKRKHGFEFSSSNITNICRAFIEESTLNTGVYASLSWLEDYIDWVDLDCSVWNAQWSSHDDFGGYAWQFTDCLEIGGITCDGDYIYQPEE